MLHVLVGGSISHWTWSLLFWRRVVEQALGLTCISIPARMLQRRATVSSFDIDSWDLNLGPCACTGGTFPSAFSPWPLSRGSTSSVPLHFPVCSLEATSLPFFGLIFKKRASGMAPALPPRLQPLQLPVKYEVFPPRHIYYAQMQKENYSRSAIKISSALPAPAFCCLIMPGSLPLRASVYSSTNYFCSQLTKINGGINIYWSSPCEQSASPGRGGYYFPQVRRHRELD